ncbi:hypothetical protein [Streptomyces sp. S.PB5]|uniref:hypothetical protein n=1 Tax=Streptomyces sp. S.PB5 TaxID=3020844 RepID=UPI0025B07A99|nr:hypothetical protein [Streptomyces sp. S.PB5]MDN3020343.1 hypothetical protein [Streptomyces sp. S.PB5]
MRRLSAALALSALALVLTVPPAHAHADAGSGTGYGTHLAHRDSYGTKRTHMRFMITDDRMISVPRSWTA